ncbi:glycosyl transferase, partial [Loktanella sp. R86503]|uniref:glycosyl transferase n=1 Tax=Loktanella sp. R86503 TaxID=3093847 RepID=UPI0036D9F576
PALPHDDRVFMRLAKGAALVHGTLTLPTGAQAAFDTYANLFNIGNWSAHGPLDALALHLTGQGDVTLHLWHITQNTPDQTLIRADVTLTATGTSIDLPENLRTGLLGWSVTARSDATLTNAAFTAAPLGNPVDLAIVITTFQREDAVRATCARITAFLDADAAQGGTLTGAHLFIIDNGQSVTLPAHPRLTLIPNRNLGGAGGFARGLAAARDAGTFTHVLFMDDDAACPMTNLTRTAAFLRHAADPKTALAGAMVSTARPWHLWENSAVFDQLPRSQFSGVDLRDADAVARMELATPAPPPSGAYGAWWYFAFPLAAVTHDPYPFFVRGDDVWFGLSNDFRIATLNGVMSLQDDFAAKASPQTLYLDMRYLLVVNMVRSDAPLGLLGCLALAWRQVLHSISRMHYDTAAAQLMAWADVLTGPVHFTANMTMAHRRAKIAALTKTEQWGPCPADLPPLHSTAQSTGWRRLMYFTLNGHLLPGFTRLGQSVCVPLQDRGGLEATCGARHAVFVDGDKAYAVRHDKRQAATLGLRGLWLILRTGLAWPRLRRAYRQSCIDLTRPAFWQAQFRAFQD